MPVEDHCNKGKVLGLLPQTKQSKVVSPWKEAASISTQKAAAWIPMLLLPSSLSSAGP